MHHCLSLSLVPLEYALTLGEPTAMESDDPNAAGRERRCWGGGMPMGVDSVDCTSLLAVVGRVVDSMAEVQLPGLVVLDAFWVSPRHLNHLYWF